MRNAWLGVGAVLSLCACGGGVAVEGTTGAGGATSTSSSSGTPTSNAASSSSSSGAGVTTGVGGGAVDGWETLIEGDWSLPGGTEGYVCVTATMQEEVWIKAFRPITPEGTHHTVLTKGGFGDDGVFPCDAGTNGQNMIYGSGVGTNDMTMPEGVAMKLEPGDRLTLNLHLFNVNAADLSGVSGTQFQRADPDDVMYEAEGTLAGTFEIFIPPQSAGSASGRCTFSSATNVFAVGPHMHQTGTHMTVTAMPQAGSPVVLHDAPYSFEDQLGYPVAPAMSLAAGDSVQVDCTYDNPTSATITFGDSSEQEMCFASLWIYPPASTGFICND